MTPDRRTNPPELKHSGQTRWPAAPPRQPQEIGKKVTRPAVKPTTRPKLQAPPEHQGKWSVNSIALRIRQNTVPRCHENEPAKQLRVRYCTWQAGGCTGAWSRGNNGRCANHRPVRSPAQIDRNHPATIKQTSTVYSDIVASRGDRVFSKLSAAFLNWWICTDRVDQNCAASILRPSSVGAFRSEVGEMRCQSPGARTSSGHGLVDQRGD